jgi:hypothetical protein
LDFGFWVEPGFEIIGVVFEGAEAEFAITQVEGAGGAVGDDVKAQDFGFWILDWVR